LTVPTTKATKDPTDARTQLYENDEKLAPVEKATKDATETGKKSSDDFDLESYDLDATMRRYEMHNAIQTALLKSDSLEQVSSEIRCRSLMSKFLLSLLTLFRCPFVLVDG